MKSYQDIKKNEIDVQNFNFLIVTATKIETESLHDVMHDTIQRIVRRIISTNKNSWLSLLGW